MEAAANELRRVIAREFRELKQARSINDLEDSVNDMSIMVATRMKQALEDDIDDAYRHGVRSAFTEPNLIKAEPTFDEEDDDFLRTMKAGGILAKNYQTFSTSLTDGLRAAITAGVASGSSVPLIVDTMRQVVNASTYKLVRIARTEINAIYNEGRLRGYAKGEAMSGRQYKYRLIVGNDTRTCEAHNELARSIPAEGLYMSDLIELQKKIAARYNLRLLGTSLLHPNQRTVLTRVV
tara:strand:- start:217 stop:927 length:711 start_codon:yes stop_codon:yes gene_type:complete